MLFYFVFGASSDSTPTPSLALCPASELHRDANMTDALLSLDCKATRAAEADKSDDLVAKKETEKGSLSVKCENGDVSDATRCTSNASNCYIPTPDDPVDVALAAALSKQ